MYSILIVFPYGRIIQGIMLQPTTFLLLSLGTKALLVEAVGRWWKVVRMIISSSSTVIMVVLECLVSFLHGVYDASLLVLVCYLIAHIIFFP